MEDNIGFKDIERKTEKIPTYVKSSLWLIIASFVFCLGLMYVYITVKEAGKSQESSRHILDDCQEKSAKVSQSADDDSHITLGKYSSNKITYINDIASKKFYVLINIREGNDITDFEKGGISLKAGKGVNSCKLYESRERIVVEVAFDNYYDLEYEKVEDDIVIKKDAISQEIPCIVIRTDEELGALCQGLTKKLEEKDFNIYLLGNEVDILSEDDYLAFVDFVKPSYYVFFDAVSKGAGELEVTSYCNSRYFIPGENSVTFSDRLLGSMAKSGSVKVTGVETCKDEDIVGKMTIPATHVVFAYGKEGQIDSINNGEKKDALIGAVIDALTNERKDK